MPLSLSGTQEQVLLFVAEFIRREGFAPSYREIRDGTMIQSISTIGYHIDQLAFEGLIRRRRNRSRAISITQKGKEWLEKHGHSPLWSSNEP